MYIHSLHRGGGAEHMMVKVSQLLMKSGYTVIVCGMVDEDPSFEDVLSAAGIRVYRMSLQKKILAAENTCFCRLDRFS